MASSSSSAAAAATAAVRARLQRLLQEHEFDASATASANLSWKPEVAENHHLRDEAATYELPLALCAALLAPGETKYSDARDDGEPLCHVKQTQDANGAASSEEKDSSGPEEDLGDFGPWAQKPALDCLMNCLDAWESSQSPPSRPAFSMTVPGVVEVEKDLAERPLACASIIAAWQALKTVCASETSQTQCSTNVDKSVDALFQALGVGGVLQLLGHRMTIGTLPVLCPAVSLLLSAFEKPNREGKPLSVGGRALAKHCTRGAADWWGGANGNDAAKNARARARLLYILRDASWVNVHVLPAGDKQTALAVAEIRCAEGYGARWTADGKMFRGFLEPVAYFQHGRVSSGQAESATSGVDDSSGLSSTA
ncbi:Hypothetical Protein FCC1311_065072 [Hondaea fermentalgiana]|uniref:Uncharacterized protein n=1 Tax=Hondaea fermentalgiana TaxID=2315210 RepID=A0A2R5GKN2_9STRA|nr:Hypothetical Protein FCC1311_065072 [Hondaea fermentalgiana]|eukprot:GBG30288.1 Hypothetical Protein FCC1311_065072 [Hondaea fermentalgiana]